VQPCARAVFGLTAITVGGITPEHFTRLWLSEPLGRHVPSEDPKFTFGSSRNTRLATEPPLGSLGVIAAGSTSHPSHVLET
jgi:hypothetical protein